MLGPDGVCNIFCDIVSGRYPALESVEMANSIRRWRNSGHDQFPPFIRRIVADVVVGTRERDEHWISLTKAEYDVPDHVLRDNINHGDDNVLLALLIHLTRRAVRTGSWTPFILARLTQIDICNTRPVLRFDFCSLWNEIAQEAWKGGADSTSVRILRELRHAYIELHRGTDAAPTAFSARTFFYNPILADPRSYRICDVPHEQTLGISIG